VNDLTNPIGDIVNIFDMLALRHWFDGPSDSAPSGPSATTPGTPQCPL
jgi:hypothetical protein